MSRRVLSLWFPRLASDRMLRLIPATGPFALTEKQQNAQRITCLNTLAETQGLARGMSYADARAFCPDLQSRPAEPEADQRFLLALLRWARRYSPWVGLDGPDGLVLDVTGVAHLFGGEEAMLADLRQRVLRIGLELRIGLADTRGAAWALAHFGEGVAEAGQMVTVLGPLPVAALRLEAKTCVALERLGVRVVADLIALPRATVTRRFGPEVLMRLDQALGRQPEEVSPLREARAYAVRMSLPEPIGLSADVMAGTGRLLERLCSRLQAEMRGARALRLTLRRVDQASQQVELRLARPGQEAARILTLFERGISEVEAGFGIDQLRLEATQIEKVPVRQLSHHVGDGARDGVDDLVTRLGSRIGLDNIQRILPADSHIPERSFITSPVAYSEPDGAWVVLRPRPLRLFSPESIAGQGRVPPRQFHWRRMGLTTGRAEGPERIAPEWWFSDENWRSGLRDYWHVETRQGRRLWLFHTPQNPGWFVGGEFA